jgi:hypothetical protein
MFKETNEGQTHSYNDGCGDPEHNNVGTQEIQDWEIEIDEWFGNGAEGDLTRGRFSIKEVKSFISQKLKEQEERYKLYTYKILQKELNTWARESIGAKAVESVIMAFNESK